MTTVEAIDISCIKQDRILFDGLSLSLTAGNLIYLTGPNGAGKTSLLRILTGLSVPDSGQVYFNGEPIHAVRQSYHQALVYVGHKSGLNSQFSPLDNLHFWAKQQGLTHTKVEILDVLERLGLVGLDNVPIKNLSAGQQRRVALARLWIKPADIWILDEPFTALDSTGVTLLETYFKQHTGTGGAIITTSHQPLSERAGQFSTFAMEYQW